MLVGGGTNGVEVFEWNGTTWTKPTLPDPIPPTRRNAGLVYDTIRSRIVLLHGQGYGDVWDYNGAGWTKRADTPGRDEHAVAFDPQSGKVLLSGGLYISAQPLRELWAYNGVTAAWNLLWTKASPSPRFYTPIAFDEIGGNTVLFGGGLVPYTYGNDTWLFDGDKWNWASTTGGPPTRWRAPMIYDSDRRVMMLYGGLIGGDAPTATRQHWELNLATLAWKDKTPPSSTPPGQRWLQASAYDRLHHRMVVHGGLNESNVRLGDTWLYDATTTTWTQMSGGASPGIRSEAAMAFDERRNVAVLFGGLVGSAGDFDGRTWEWNGSSWHDAAPSTGSPPSRRMPSLVYDPDRGTVVLSGGNNSFSGHVEALSDLWEFDGNSWRQLNQAASPKPIARWVSAVTYDRTHHRLVHFSGASIENPNYASGQAWELTLPCRADFNCDGFVNGDDFDLYVAAFAAGDIDADFNGDGFVTGDDFDAYVVAFYAGC